LRPDLKASEQVVTLVDGINTYVKSKEALPHLEKVKVKEIIESVRNEFADALSRRRIRWTQPETLPEVVADKLGMQRIFQNLVENALKYGGEALSEISIHHGDSPAFHSFSVSDNGVGIKAEGARFSFSVSKILEIQETDRSAQQGRNVLAAGDRIS
jgi:light-regulated signal transduction histidine kinase (bacteriophytochrome)